MRGTWFKWSSQKVTVEIEFSIGWLHMASKQLVNDGREKLAKTIIWTWADFFFLSIELIVFSQCWQLESSRMETWPVQSSQTQKDSLGPPNSTIKWWNIPPPDFCFLYDTSPEKVQKDELQESVVSRSESSCRDPGGLEVLGTFFLSLWNRFQDPELCLEPRQVGSRVWSPRHNIHISLSAQTVLSNRQGAQDGRCFGLVSFLRGS